MLRDLIFLAIGAIGGVIATYFIVKNNESLIVKWYGKIKQVVK